MLEKEKSVCGPDNTVTMDINGTKYIIDEFLNGTDTINDIIVKRVKRELNPAVPSRGNGYIPCYLGETEV